jgi:sugar lactone lactonase YvrE
MIRANTFLRLLAIGGLAAILLASASATERWIQGSRVEFLKGDPDSASISSDGTIMLPPVAEKLFDAPQPFIWRLAVNATGQLYAAGGNDGIIYDGRGNPVHDSDKPEVYALAFGPDGRLYFASSPAGAVYRLGADGKAEEFYRPSAPRADGTQGPPERYIWDMAFDAAGNLYLATGIEGRIFKVTTAGTGSVIFDSDEAHITCITIDSRGRVLFGSDPGGHISQLDQSGKVFVLFDAPMKEINNIVATADGVIYATGIAEGALKVDEQAPAEKEEGEEPVGPKPLLSRTSSVTVATATDGAEANGELSAVYRILPDSSIEKIWASASQVAYSLAWDAGGKQVIFGTGPRGALIAIDSNGTERVLRKLEGNQISALAAARGDVYAAVSNLGAVYRVANRFAEKGTYLSQVKDTGAISDYGAIRWDGAGEKIAIHTRSGNTEKPDNTWSDWSAAYADAGDSRIASPPARFIQWKAELSTLEPGRSPQLKSVSLYYLQRNMRPRVRSVAILPAGIFFRPGMSDPEAQAIPQEIVSELREHNISADSMSSIGKVVFEQPMRTARWSAMDANGDTLRYHLRYRRTTETAWSTLAENLNENWFSFDSRTLGDGTYVIRVEAEDGLSNTRERTLSGSLDTQPFDVDNTPPQVTGLTASAKGRAVALAFDAVDSFSTIKIMRARVGSGEWTVLLPVDGIPDSRSEKVQVTIPDLAVGEHVITVQVVDELYNIGAGSVRVTVR